MNQNQRPLENQIRRACLRIQNAHQWKRQIARLGSANPAESGEAREWLLAQGDVSLPALYRALRRSPNVACGAAGLLNRMGSPQGVRHILLRAYQDEWFTFYSTRDIADYGAHIGLRIGKEPVYQAVGRALEEAQEQHEEQACLQTLIVALSGLRAIAHVDPPCEPGHAPPASTDFWARALHFGPYHLRHIHKGNSPIPLLANMTGWIRVEAIRRLLREQDKEVCLSLLTGALRRQDRHVVRSAIDGLQCLGDPRAIPELETIAFTPNHPLALHARRAIERLAGAQAEVLTLVRASREETAAEELLRPVRPHADAPHSLLRSLDSFQI